MVSFHVAPGVYVNEKDLTLQIGAVGSTEAAIGGVFRWGPIGVRTLIDSEANLVKTYGRPTNHNPETFFSAASFLAYGNQLYVSRDANTAGITPIVVADIEAANAVVVLASGNTAELVVGLTLMGTSNSSAIATGTVNSIVNATAFTLTTGAHALATTSGVTLQFVSNTCFSAVANTGTVANLSAQIVKNPEHFAAIDGTFDTDVPFVARYPGDLGNSLRVSMCGNSTGFATTINLASSTYGTNVNFTAAVNSNTISIIQTAASQSAANTAADALNALLNVSDLMSLGNSTIGTQLMKVTAIDAYTSNSTAAVTVVHFEDTFKLSANVAYGKTTSSNTLTRYWEFYNLVDNAPGISDFQLASGNTSASDEVHLVVVDENGKFTGVPGTVLEVYENASRATDSRKQDGTSNYYRNLINNESQYIWAVNDISGATSALAASLTNSTLDVRSLPFYLGKDGLNELDIPLGIITRAYDLFASGEDVDVSLVITGHAATIDLTNYLVDNIAEVRKDCVVFSSAPKSAVVNNVGFEESAITTWAGGLRASSYLFLDSGMKYMYDRYNDVYRWVPLNGDIAGLAARSDENYDPWWSFAGYNRGQIKNLVKVAWNPRKASQIVMSKISVNPVVSEQGQGTNLLGDKTHLGKNSAFSHINVRRLFITMEKSIARAAKFMLFEFNDAFTRASFLNMVNPYLRTIKARRGVYDARAVCNESNNPPEIIDNSEFVGDIYVKPSRSINAITLNFVAVGTGVSFTEVENQF